MPSVGSRYVQKCQSGGPTCGERRLPWSPVCVKIESALSDIGQPINAWTRRQCGANRRGAVGSRKWAARTVVWPQDVARGPCICPKIADDFTINSAENSQTLQT